MSKIVTLSEAASIAIHGMILIAKAEKVTNVLAIAERTQTSKHHVAKILQRLVKENFLQSNRGPTGGFSLKQPSSQISLLDIYEAIEGKVTISSCPMDKSICSFEKCIVDNITKDLTISFRDFLKAKTLDMYI